MREPASREDDRQDPAELDAEIRRLTVEVWLRVQEWYGSTNWQDTERNRHRYDVTARAAAAIDELAAARSRSDIDGLIEAIRPVLPQWGPALAGSEQAIHAAIVRLQSLIEAIQGSGG